MTGGRRGHCTVTLTVACVKLFVMLYPANTRRRFGRDLVELARDFVQDTHAGGGPRAVIRAWPRLFADLAMALIVEYRDLRGDKRSVSERFVTFCLAAAALVWILIFAASALDWRWAARTLDADPVVTMVLAFGLPMIAAGASRLRCASVDRGKSQLRYLRTSVAATVGSWSLLLFHLAQCR